MKTALFLVILTALSRVALAQQVIPAADFAQTLAATPQVQLVDVRTPEEFEKGHLKGARNVDYRSEQFEVLAAKLDKSRPVFVYCQVGGRSRAAADWLTKQGYKTVYDLKGGFQAWSAAGLPATK
ncbi:MAG: rhodanese-like domain-containing protein [Cytophagaceae bacterium]|nr:rhodanese-like domain-containing protein [Cytophagaceae bacterium]